MLDNNEQERVNDNDTRPPVIDTGILTDVTNEEPKKKKKSMGMRVLEILIIIVVAFMASALLRTFVLTPYEIPSGSMEDTILIGDRVFAEKISFITGEPQPGDIVTFKDPENEKRTLIKRVIATEGQTVDFADGKVIVDGEELDEDYAIGESEPLDSQAEGVTIVYPYEIKENEMWVMGDNRENSQDSRYFGSVPIENVTGKAFFRYWPVNSMGSLYE